MLVNGLPSVIRPFSQQLDEPMGTRRCDFPDCIGTLSTAELLGEGMVELRGLEPLTSSLQRRRSPS